MTKSETATQTRLRRALEALETARANELAAIHTLNEARAAKERAKTRYTELFLKEELEESTRRQSDYRHTTK